MEQRGKIIPVIDLKEGLVVRAVAGRRDEYQPVSSCLCAGAEPAQVAAAFREHLECELVYVADLDAIAGKSPNQQSWQAIADCGLRLILDAGVRNVPQLESLWQFHEATGALDGMVVALESIPSVDSLRQLGRRIGPDQAVFSLDMKGGRPITDVPEFADAAAETIVESAVDCGFRRLIVLDLTAVGTFEGPRTTTLVRQLRRRFAHIQILAGGGVRHDDDLRTLIDAGCDGVLVASALHNGMLL